ncbi:uncharacterized protein LOC128212201 [Mya arenaria]|uniref:uncharacterized protein LOC128212201 n=1 Tax=Mya arenaria TaxID=6604 RepID=UPI0022E6E07F|nr:uncharacterized protein LOC128212201 [Mya arenaria]
MNIFFTAATFYILLFICDHFVTVEAASGEKKLKLEALPVNGSDDIVSKLSVSGNGQRNGNRNDYCSGGGGMYCQTGTYCCYNGGCCEDGYECCSAEWCCGDSGAAGLTGNIVMLLCCITGYVLTSMDKNNSIKDLTR